ncbi:hypothetical protein PG984_002958 [Apiospora sp. TS-2023a]
MSKDLMAITQQSRQSLVVLSKYWPTTTITTTSKPDPGPTSAPAPTATATATPTPTTWTRVAASGENALGVSEFAQIGATYAVWSHWVPKAVSGLWGFAKRNLLRWSWFRDQAEVWRLFSEEDFANPDLAEVRAAKAKERMAVAAAEKAKKKADDLAKKIGNQDAPPVAPGSSSLQLVHRRPVDPSPGLWLWLRLRLSLVVPVFRFLSFPLSTAVIQEPEPAPVSLRLRAPAAAPATLATVLRLQPLPPNVVCWPPTQEKTPWALSCGPSGTAKVVKGDKKDDEEDTKKKSVVSSRRPSPPPPLSSPSTNGRLRCPCCARPRRGVEHSSESSGSDPSGLETVQKKWAAAAIEKAAKEVEKEKKKAEKEKEAAKRRAVLSARPPPLSMAVAGARAALARAETRSVSSGSGPTGTEGQGSIPLQRRAPRG